MSKNWSKMPLRSICLLYYGQSGIDHLNASNFRCGWDLRGRGEQDRDHSGVHVQRQLLRDPRRRRENGQKSGRNDLNKCLNVDRRHSKNRNLHHKIANRVIKSYQNYLDWCFRRFFQGADVIIFYSTVATQGWKSTLVTNSHVTLNRQSESFI